MRNSKLSFALVVAILAVSVTVATQAKAIFGKRVITACFTSIVVSDGSAQSDLNVFPTCLAAKNYAVIANPNSHIYVQSASAPGGIDCVPVETLFCCAKVVETLDTRAQEIDLGDGLKRYKISQILCKPE